MSVLALALCLFISYNIHHDYRPAQTTEGLPGLTALALKRLRYAEIHFKADTVSHLDSKPLKHLINWRCVANISLADCHNNLSVGTACKRASSEIIYTALFRSVTVY